MARARDNFTNTAAKLIRNEYGGTVGGPVYIPKVYNGKNKTFWFFNYEGLKQRSGGIGSFRVPTQAMRDGDFSDLVDTAGTDDRSTTRYRPVRPPTCASRSTTAASSIVSTRRASARSKR